MGSGEVLVFERTLELADELKKLRVVADDAPTLSMPKMPKGGSIDICLFRPESMKLSSPNLSWSLSLMPSIWLTIAECRLGKVSHR